MLPSSKIVPRRAITRPLTLRDYADRHKQILINRQIGGLGDILMHRMMFEDIHNLGLEVHFACPTAYHAAVIDHPYVAKVLDCHTVDPYEYLVAYNTTTACGRYESKIAPLADLHRSDIWSKHCGIDLKNHNMHMRITDEEKSIGRKLIDSERSVCLCPRSAMPSKDLNQEQIAVVVAGLRDRGFSPFGLHREPIPELDACGVPTLVSLPLRQWMAVIDQSDAVISVDTAGFHCAGGLGKPLVGVFTWADGKVYGRYFKFSLVQKHRDNGNWDCGPCYAHSACPKSKLAVKPCLSEIKGFDILAGFDLLNL